MYSLLKSLRIHLSTRCRTRRDFPACSPENILYGGGGGGGEEEKVGGVTRLLYAICEHVKAEAYIRVDDL